MKSTQAMRDRIRELMSREQDDYDRAVECVLDDLEALLKSGPAQSHRFEPVAWRWRLFRSDVWNVCRDKADLDKLDHDFIVQPLYAPLGTAGAVEAERTDAQKLRNLADIFNAEIEKVEALPGYEPDPDGGSPWAIDSEDAPSAALDPATVEALKHALVDLKASRTIVQHTFSEPHGLNQTIEMVEKALAGSVTSTVRTSASSTKPGATSGEGVTSASAGTRGESPATIDELVAQITPENIHPEFGSDAVSQTHPAGDKQ